MSSPGGSPFVKTPKKVRRCKSIRKIPMYYQNVRGLRTKTATFYKNISVSGCHIIALTETFLKSSVCDGELFPPGYIVLRKDRACDVGWGGVLLAVRDHYTVKLITDVDGLSDDKEILVAKIMWKNYKLLICVVYLPPNYNDSQYVDVLTCLENVICKYSSFLDILIFGDFNLNSCSAAVRLQFEMFLDFCKLKQHNTVLNSHGGMLDLVLSCFSSGSVAVSDDVEPLVPADAYHPPVEVTLSLVRGNDVPDFMPSPPACSTSYAPDWNFHKADYCSLYSSVSAIDWTEVLSEQDVDAAVDLFYLKLNTAVSSHVPLKRNVMSLQWRQYPPWYNAEIKSKLKIKHFHLKKFKELGLQFNLEVFRYYRTHIKELDDNAYKQYIASIGSNIGRDPRQFWKHVRQRRSGRGQPNEYTLDGVPVAGQEAAAAFGEYFSSVFLNDVPALDSVAAERVAATGDARLVVIDSVTVADLRRAVRRLKSSSAAGPDAIPPFLAKDCFSVLELPLLHIFNRSLHICRYPVRWKVSRVVPIPKVASSTDVTTYRPIAVLAVFGKIFESVVNYYLTRQIEPYLHDSQHGFRVARSTTTNHITFVDSVSADMDGGRQVDALFLDFRRAFDVVDNDILLVKLSKLGASPKLLQFLADYLKDRRQYVHVKMHKSDEFYTRSGVSQGSTLGPTLFLAMINDLPTALSTSQCLMFADDLKVYQSVSEASDCVRLQRDIESVENWSRVNRLAFNTAKCKVVSFTRSSNPIAFSYTLGGSTLDRENKIQDLGVILDDHLDFREHVVNICKNTNRTLGFIMRTASQFPDISVAITLYNAFVRSKLEFDATVWDPREAKYTLLIERLQRKFARYVYKRMFGYYPYLFPSLFVSGMIGLDTLELRRKLLLVVHYCQILRNRVNNPTVLGALALFVPNCSHSRRRPHKLFLRPISRTRHASNAPTQRAMLILNSFAHEFEHVDLFTDSMSTIVTSIRLYLSHYLR